MSDVFRRSVAAAVLFAACLFAGPAAAATSADDIAAAADAAVAAEMERSGAPGATVAVIAEGRVALVRGYGFADLKAGARVDGDRTMFRIGSITKIFTALAAMQLVERGKLSLDGDVNAVSGAVQVPDAFGAAVTLRHLLTHTAGFEETACGTRSRIVDDARPIARAIGDGCVPPRMYPPGRIGIYTNFAFYLIGHLVERASGLGYHDYLEANIFGPLGLAHTTSRQAVPAALVRLDAVGYAMRGGEPTPQPFDVNDPPSSGGIGASAGDMAILMQALLNGGGPILSPGTLRQMQSVAFAQDARVGAIGLGFHIWNWRTPVVLGHNGQTKQFRAEMWLAPEAGFAVFVAMNADTARPMNVAKALLDRFAPNTAPAATGAVTPDAARHAALAGPYKAARFGLYGPLRLMNILRGVEIAFDGEGRLMWRGAPLTEREPDYFVSDDGATRIAVTTAEGVNGPFLIASDATVYPFFKRGWMDAPATQYWIMGLAAAAMASVLAIWPFAAWMGRATPGRRRAFVWQGLLLLLAFLALAAALAIHAEVGVDLYYYGVEGVQKIAFVLPALAAVLVLAALAHLPRAALPGWARLQALACSAALGLALVFFAHWNLIGWWF